MADPLASMKVKALFFDRQKVRRAVDRATLRALSKAGAFIRRRAKSSIKPALKARTPPPDLRGQQLRDWLAAERVRRSSKPGEPPRSHTGLLKKRIFFAFEPSTKTVVVGPVRIGSRQGRDVPRVLEFGGQSAVEERRFRNRRPVIVRRTAQIGPRPYMGPALKQELPNLPVRWRNSVRGG